MGIHLKVCPQCGATFEAQFAQRRFCSNDCLQLRHHPAKPVAERQCPVCATAFMVAGNHQRKFCSKRCKDWDEARQPYTKAYNAEYRARKRTQSVERVKPELVLERDGHICQLCFEPVDLTVGPRHRLAPSLDHIVPISKGGAHSYANIQLAHIGCNAKKCDRLEVAA